MSASTTSGLTSSKALDRRISVVDLDNLEIRIGKCVGHETSNRGTVVSQKNRSSHNCALKSLKKGGTGPPLEVLACAGSCGISSPAAALSTTFGSMVNVVLSFAVPGRVPASLPVPPRTGVGAVSAVASSAVAVDAAAVSVETGGRGLNTTNILPEHRSVRLCSAVARGPTPPDSDAGWAGSAR